MMNEMNQYEEMLPFGMANDTSLSIITLRMFADWPEALGANADT